MTLRCLILLFFVILCPLSASAGEIDGLKTASDVNQFLKKVIPKYAEDLLLDTKEAPKTEFGKNTFHKVDLDGDGASDLIVESKYLFAVTEKHNLFPIDKGAFMLRKYTLLRIEKNRTDTLLHIRPIKEEDIPAPESDKELTLVFKFGGFIEFNPKPDHMTIKSIAFSTSGCFGSCPIFGINILADRRATYRADKYNPEEGEFSGIIDTVGFDRLTDIINYMSIASLKTEYAVP